MTRPRGSARAISLAILTSLGASLGGCPAPRVAGDDAAREPPPAPREFRAAWVSTVANIDWPSKKGLPVAEQQAEILRIVDRAKELNLNALVLQVRPCADAIYPSEREPWSEFLTGEQGKAPDPFYDPLKMWVDEAHKRGIEIHAWFNPYRARHKDATSPPAKSHISQTTPAVVKTYGEFQWMDPGEPAAVEQTLGVILDVVHRYDIDGVHIDDYFYPYPIPVPAPPSVADAGVATQADAGPSEPLPEQDFPDEPSWQAYLASGGTLARADWRRKNVSDLIERLYTGVHREKSWIKSGISPFGLGRPDRRPPNVSGFSQYDKLYADVELWLERGWLDYLSPQLYWPIAQAKQPFPTLLDYWLRENRQSRHVWPGLFTSRIDGTAKSWQPEEVLNQIHLARERRGAQGQVHFSMISLLENRKSIGDRLLGGPYASAALVPAMPWLDGAPPQAPRVELDVPPSEAVVRVRLASAEGKPASRFALFARYGRSWAFRVVPAADMGVDLEARTAAGALDAVVVSAVDRVGNESPRVRVTVNGSLERSKKEARSGKNGRSAHGEVGL